MDVKPILRISTAMQSLALAKKGMKLAKKKRAKASDFIKVGAGTIVGVEMIKAQSNIIEGM